MVASTSVALERRSVKAEDLSRDDGWRDVTTCSIVYHNTCTGWIWVWSGWQADEVLGMTFDSCCPGGAATAVDIAWLYWATGSPGGYGFTGTIDLSDADNSTGCPTGSPLQSQFFLPLDGWNQVLFGAQTVPDDTFVLTYTTGSGPLPNPMQVATDHPAVGPSGPQACGTCYPTTRANHSFFFGTVAAPLCPGSVYSDGICDAQLIWDIQLTCTTSVDPSSWSSLKGLYR
jgi:hypothetical protein